MLLVIIPSGLIYVVNVMEHSLTILQIWRLILISGAIFVFFQSIIQIWNGRKTIKLLGDFNAFDKKLMKCGTFICYSTEKTRICWITCGVLMGPVFAAIILSMDYFLRNGCILDCNLGHLYQFIFGIVHVIQLVIFTDVFTFSRQDFIISMNIWHTLCSSTSSKRLDHLKIWIHLRHFSMSFQIFWLISMTTSHSISFQLCWTSCAITFFLCGHSFTSSIWISMRCGWQYSWVQFGQLRIWLSCLSSVTLATRCKQLQQKAKN